MAAINFKQPNDFTVDRTEGMSDTAYEFLNSEMSQRERREQLGYLLKLRLKLGREITEQEMDSLSNIL